MTTPTMTHPLGDRLAAWSKRYRQLGWWVVPLNEDRCAMFRWKHYRDDPDAYARDVAKWDADNVWEQARGVGLLTEFSGVLVADVDVPFEEASDHLNNAVGEGASLDALSYGVSRTQSGRVHLFFATGDRPPERLRNLSAETAKKIGCPNIELKHFGACVPLPPTETNVGCYTWIMLPTSQKDRTLRLHDVPGWVDTIYDRLTAYERTKARDRDAARNEHEQVSAEHETRIRAAQALGVPVRMESPTEEVERALSYQAAVPSASEPGRYDALLSLTGKLADNGFSESAAWSAMVAFGKRCAPPFSEGEMRVKTLDKRLSAIIQYEPREVIERPASVGREVSNAARNDEAESPNWKAPPLPEEARRVEDDRDGACPWLTEYVEFASRESPRSFGDFHTAIATWIMATVAARRVRADFGGDRFTPYQGVLVANSTDWAKTTATDIGRSLLREAGLDFFLAPDESTPQALVARMQVEDSYELGGMDEERRVRVRNRIAFAGQRGWFYEEFGGHLRKMNRRDSSYAEFHSILRRFYDCPQNYRSDTIGRGEVHVERPYLALLGNLTYADLAPFAGRNDAMWHDGFYARFHFVAVPPDAVPSLARFPTAHRVYPDSLVTPLHRWHDRLGIPLVTFEDMRDADGQPTGRSRSIVEPTEPLTVALSTEVVELYYTYERALTYIRRDGAWSAPALEPNYGRLPRKALSMAMLFASMDDRDEVERGDWALSQHIVEGWRRGSHIVYAKSQEPDRDRGTSRTVEPLDDRIVRLVLKHGAMTFNDLRRFVGKAVSDAMLSAACGRLYRKGALATEDQVAANHRAVTVYRVADAVQRSPPTEETA
ncbi:MAG: bifunctional DNA primase/polymerase, partial [Candidatus Poribacteria bacterium]|nr:bifunctional DNA primase/polymerase [Candidatus Poribacteria bacterium]